MLSEVFLKRTEELYDSSILYQTSYWSAVKERLGSQTLAFDFKCHSDKVYLLSADQGQTFMTDVFVIIQQIDANHSIAYVPYGPEVEPLQENQGLFLEQLSESLRSLLPSHCFMIRFDLNWESHWSGIPDFYDEAGFWLGPPEPHIQELRLNYATDHWSLRKSRTNCLPSNTYLLDLRPSEEIILRRMKPKTRYNIRLSSRKGVVVRECSIDELDTWYALYTQTALRNGLYLHDISYFKTVLSCRSQMGSSDEIKLLIAYIDTVPLSALFLVKSQERATYLYGASSSSHREFMGSYALQWRAIQDAKQMGCKEYDMFGISPSADRSHPMYGLYRFKSGFGGRFFHTLGSWDYAFDEEKYHFFQAKEAASQGYYV